MVQAPRKSPTFTDALVLQGVDWARFKAIQASFAGMATVRLAYCEGVLEIMGIGKPHELYSYQLGLLLGVFFVESRIEYFPSGAFTQAVVGQVEYQADLSYCFGTDKPVPDLCIEVVVTSGSPIKLQKYQVMGVPEVWFWEDGCFSLYGLRAEGYERLDRSIYLPTLDLALLNRCLMMASPLEAVTVFQKALQEK